MLLSFEKRVNPWNMNLRDVQNLGTNLDLFSFSNVMKKYAWENICEEMQSILEHNTKENDNLTFIHVVNGLAPSIVTGVSTYYILVIKAKTAHGIVWSYVVNVTKYFTIPSPSYHLNSFRDVIPYK